MTDEQFETVIEEMMAKLDETESSQFMRIVLKYMMFDLAATRRERDELKMTLEDQI